MSVRHRVDRLLTHLGEWVEGAHTTIDDTTPDEDPGDLRAVIADLGTRITALRADVHAQVTTDRLVVTLRGLGLDVEPWMVPHIHAEVSTCLSAGGGPR